MKVFGHPASTCTRKVLLTLNEKHQGYEFITVNLAKGEHKSAEHLKHQPFGVVPVIDDNGFFLYESRAIIRYLDAKLPGISLTPKEPHNYGLMEQWMSVEQSYFSGPVIQIVKQCLWAPKQGHTSDPNIVDPAQKQVELALDVIEVALKKQRFLADNEFSLADICWMPYMQYLFAAGKGDLILHRHHVAKWWEFVSTRPTWEAVNAA